MTAYWPTSSPTSTNVSVAGPAATRLSGRAGDPQPHVDAAHRRRRRCAHASPHPAPLTGRGPVEFALVATEPLDGLRERLAAGGIAPGPIVAEPCGRSMQVTDPDGLVIQVNEHEHGRTTHEEGTTAGLPRPETRATTVVLGAAAQLEVRDCRRPGDERRSSEASRQCPARNRHRWP